MSCMSFFLVASSTGSTPRWRIENYDAVWCVCVPSYTDAALTWATMHCSLVASVASRAHVLQEWEQATPSPWCQDTFSKVASNLSFT